MTRNMAIKWLKWIQNMFSEDSEQYKALQFAINSMEVDEAYQLEYEKTTSKFPAVEGALAEMLVDGKWIKGKIIKGYRFDDGIVTIEAEDGHKYWCGQSRTDCYREIKDGSYPTENQ